ncbi:MAG: two-component system osmolarity sensor histidine kinase EnvZ [Paracoccaceae bacterium]|jgi:two-component system osmolarity sensor histidine kinase EnvZ
MDFIWLKRSMPRGLYGRAALILVLPIAVLQLVIAVVFIQRHFEDVTRQMTDNLLLDLKLVLAQVEAGRDVAAVLTDTAGLQGALNMTVAFDNRSDGAQSKLLPRGFRRFPYDLSGRTVIRRLKARMPGVTAVDLSRSIREVDLVIASRHGPVLMTFDRRRVSASNPHQLLVLMLLTGVVMTGVAFLYLRNQLRPITRLAAAADAFGKGRIEPYQAGGAIEVRAAGNAFLDMRNRIERQTLQRIQMLSGVSHDLRTPLTRLRLGLSLQVPTHEIEEMVHDVADMEALVTAFLDFARSDTLDDPEEVDPAVLAAEAVEQGARGGGRVTLFEVSGQIETLVLRPLAIRRALANLIGNALRYGNRAEVSLTVSERMVRFTVEDDGPGIPQDQRDEALRPFIRLDAARNQNRGSGVGLGLSIAADIARSHGGTLRLGESVRLGGLKVDIVLAR